MRDSSFKKSFFIFSKSSIVLPSNLKTNIGVVFEALIRPQPLSKLILRPSNVTFSPFRVQFDEKFSIISNLLSSVTLIFSSGVEYNFGKSFAIHDML